MFTSKFLKKWILSAAILKLQQLDVLLRLFLSELRFSQTVDCCKVGYAEIMNISPFMAL